MDTIRPILKKALSLIDQPPGSTAIDFGIGGGEEAAHLLQHGYRVTAIDNFEEFLTELSLREDVQSYRDHLTTLQADFENVPWECIEPVDLFLASFSLWYIKSEKFHEVWKAIVNAIKPGGYFVGHMSTHQYKALQQDGYFIEEPQVIPFLSKEEMLKLLKGLEILYFDQVEKLYTPQSASPPDDLPFFEGTIYGIIARKI